MRILITGICGFIGSSVAVGLKKRMVNIKIVGVDNLCRAGSEMNRSVLKKWGIQFFHGDLRMESDMRRLPACDVLIDAAANPSVLAGLQFSSDSRLLMEHNLLGTLNLLECCRQWKCKLILLSTSRVYSIAGLNALPLRKKGHAFVLKKAGIENCSEDGIDEGFSTEPPLSLYGTSKKASEVLAQEYSASFDFPLFINRCGVLAGSGQFGKADQGIFSYWIRAFHARKKMKFIGFGGLGDQVRDCLHPDDLTELLIKQIQASGKEKPVLGNVSGGAGRSISLHDLNQWCADRFGKHPIGSERGNRPFDVPWLVLDSARVRKSWNWKPQRSLDSIFEEIASHAESHPHWLDQTTD